MRALWFCAAMLAIAWMLLDDGRAQLNAPPQPHQSPAPPRAKQESPAATISTFVVSLSMGRSAWLPVWVSAR